MDEDTLPDAPPAVASMPSPPDDGAAPPKQESSPPPDLPPATAEDVKDVKNLFVGDEDDLTGDTVDAEMLASEAQLDLPPVKPVSGGDDPEVIRTFYQRLFPWRQLFQWLNHSPVPCKDFGNREFAFTLPNEVYLRFQSFPNFETLRKEVLRLNPSRFEIGPVYSANPRDRKSLTKAAFRPLQKELVFDIDMDEYNPVRTCCDGKNICHKCWNFITMAIKVLNVSLREDFGFKHVMWVYSGRRGAHAWICDKDARFLDDSQRRAIVSYLSVVMGGNQGGKRVNLWRPLHPHLVRSLDILKGSFGQKILVEQDPWRENERAEYLLKLLPDKTINEELRKKWAARPDRPSIKKWEDIDEVAASGVSKTYNSKQMLEAKQDVVFEYTYPRLDAAVSKALNHLLKSPFVVHPATGRVCVPIDANKPEDFDPFGVPTVTGILKELDDWAVKNKDKESEGTNKLQDYEKTSLKPYVEQFKVFVAGILRDEGASVKKERANETSTNGGGSAMEF